MRAYLSVDNGKTWGKIWSSDTSIYAINKIGNYLFLGSLKSIFQFNRFRRKLGFG